MKTAIGFHWFPYFVVLFHPFWHFRLFYQSIFAWTFPKLDQVHSKQVLYLEIFPPQWPLHWGNWLKWWPYMYCSQDHIWKNFPAYVLFWTLIPTFEKIDIGICETWNYTKKRQLINLKGLTPSWCWIDVFILSSVHRGQSAICTIRLALDQSQKY